MEETKKYKVGDKVKLNPNIKEFEYGKGDVGYDEIGEITGVESNKYVVKFPSQSRWFGLEEELISIYDFEVGDIVRINKNITLGDLPKNHWNGCQIATMDFLKSASFTSFDKEYEVIDSGDNFVEVKGYGDHINIVIFKLVKKAEKPIKEMTIAEIEKELGYSIKVVKENDNESD